MAVNKNYKIVTLISECEERRKSDVVRSPWVNEYEELICTCCWKVGHEWTACFDTTQELCNVDDGSNVSGMASSPRKVQIRHLRHIDVDKNMCSEEYASKSATKRHRNSEEILHGPDNFDSLICTICWNVGHDWAECKTIFSPANGSTIQTAGSPNCNFFYTKKDGEHSRKRRRIDFENVQPVDGDRPQQEVLRKDTKKSRRRYLRRLPFYGIDDLELTEMCFNSIHDIFVASTTLRTCKAMIAELYTEVELLVKRMTSNRHMDLQKMTNTQAVIINVLRKIGKYEECVETLVRILRSAN